MPKKMTGQVCKCERKGNCSANIGKQIQKIRKQQSVSQETMAEKLHITRERFGKMENGISTITVDDLDQIAQLLGVSISALWSECGIDSRLVDASELIYDHFH